MRESCLQAGRRIPGWVRAAGRGSGDRIQLRQLIVRGLSSAFVVWLGLLHAQLLMQRIATWTLFEPLVILRWGFAALLVVALLRLQRAGVSIVHGHRALALWLLVILLHAGMLPADIDSLQPLGEPVLLAMSAWGAVLWVRACPTSSRTDQLGHRLTWQSAVDRSRPPAEPGFFDPLVPRPPPSRFVL